MLVCNTSSPANEKLKHAREWRVPIVSSDWLWDSLREEKFKSFATYLIRHSSNDLAITELKPPENRTEATRPEIRSNLSNETTKSDRTRLLLDRTLDSANNEHGGQTTDDLNVRVVEDSPMKNELTNVDAIGPSEIHDTANTDECHDSKTHPLGPISAPLKEISLNSSPKAPVSPTKIVTTSSKASTSVKISDDSLGPAISSLLAHHQRLSTTNPMSKPADDAKVGRRRRQLFGRAPSSLSARSTGSVSISRASSVDTMNTDGLGTPLETSTTHTRDEADDSFAVLHGVSEKESFRESIEQPPQMTQLGYEDPDVRAWRERAIKKLGGAGQIELDTGKRVEGIGVVTDVVGGRAARGIGRRTRQALGR